MRRYMKIVKNGKESKVYLFEKEKFSSERIVAILVGKINEEKVLNWKKGILNLQPAFL